jgi:hypothetical protein
MALRMQDASRRHRQRPLDILLTCDSSIMVPTAARQAFDRLGPASAEAARTSAAEISDPQAARHFM